MRKMLLAAAFLAATNFPVLAKSPEKCLVETGGLILPENVNEVGGGCKRYLFPPAPGAAIGAAYSLGGEEIEAVIENCGMYEGRPIDDAPDTPRYCRVVAFPSADGKTLTFGN